MIVCRHELWGVQPPPPQQFQPCLWHTISPVFLVPFDCLHWPETWTWLGGHWCLVCFSFFFYIICFWLRVQPFKAYCCHTGTAIMHPVPDRVKPSFVIFDIRALWRSECPDVKNDKWRLNPVWHRMHYSCTRMATVGLKGLSWPRSVFQSRLNSSIVSYRIVSKTVIWTVRAFTLVCCSTTQWSVAMWSVLTELHK